MNTLTIIKSRFFSHSPFRLVHDITYRCNCRCKICERWKKSSDYKDDLSTEDIFKMLDDAKRAGIVMYVVEGGEPFFRKDISRILKHAKKLKMSTTIVTNGYYLRDRCKEIMPFIDSIVVSLDSNDELHDEMRGLKGLLNRATEGIKICKKNGIKIVINSVLCKLNMGKVDGLVKLSTKLEIPIVFQPMDVYRGYNEHLRLTNLELQRTFKKIVEYKKSGHKILNSYHYLEHIINNKKYVCHAPKCYTYVEPSGNIVSCCDIVDKTWGNVKNSSFKEIFEGKEFKNFCKEMERCNKCSINAVIESSLFYSLNPKYLF